MGGMGRRRLRLLGALVAAGMVVAACGQNGKKAPSGLEPPGGGSTVSTTATADASTPEPTSGATSTTKGPSTPGTTTRTSTTSKAPRSGGAGSTSSTQKPQQQVQITAGPSTAPSQPPQAGGSLTI